MYTVGNKLPNEPTQKKKTKTKKNLQNHICAQRTLRSACASALPNLRIRVAKGLRILHPDIAKTLFRCADAQSEVKFRWENKPLCWFCCAPAQIAWFLSLRCLSYFTCKHQSTLRSFVVSFVCPNGCFQLALKTWPRGLFCNPKKVPVMTKYSRIFDGGFTSASQNVSKYAFLLIVFQKDITQCKGKLK